MNKLIFCMSIFTCVTLSALPSCVLPKTIAGKVVIDLTDDIVITNRGTPVVADSVRNGHIIFTSKTKNKIIIKKTGVWDLSSFNNKSKIIELAGNAQLVCEPGSKIIFNDCVLRFSGSAQWIYS